MRPIHRVRMDKVRPAVVLTREVATTFLNGITVAPITTTIYGIATEVPVGRVNGLDRDGVISCDNITTVDAVDVLDQIGVLRDQEEGALVRAIHEAFDLDPLAR
jgi:mRNA interferase MazF